MVSFVHINNYYSTIRAIIHIFTFSYNSETFCDEMCSIVIFTASVLASVCSFTALKQNSINVIISMQ